MRSATLRQTSGSAVPCDRLRVALVTDRGDAFARGCMTGISRWVRNHPAWALVVEEASALATPSPGRRRSPPDGVISWLAPAELPRSWRSGDVPLVFIAAHPGGGREPSVATDDELAVRLAVDHLVEQGARHLGYVPDAIRREDRRIAVLRDHSRRHGASCDVFDSGGRGLAAWVAALPRPLGIVAGSDGLGLKVLDACRDAGIRVPDDAAVVGMGNDDCLCDLAIPALSSVAHNLAGLGHEACRLLADLLAGRTARRALLLPPAGVVVRGSSDSVAADDPVVRRALRAIRGLAAEGLTPDALAEQVGLPRRALDRQFRKQFGRTVHEELVRARLAQARKLLAETDLKLLAVAVRSGFHSASQLCHSFKEAFGGSPMDYRRQVRPWDVPPPGLKTNGRRLF